MTQVVQTGAAPTPEPVRSVDRISRRQVDKFAERRAQLAESALLTLSELGYARTSLREIAQNSEFSHGVLHYYFRDKVDLITHCVREYKARCVTRYDQIAATATTADELRVGFAAGLAQTMVQDAHLHRLWYDLRSQSMFEASFRDDVAAIDASLERMIWRIVSQYADQLGAAPAVSPGHGLRDVRRPVPARPDPAFVRQPGCRRPTAGHGGTDVADAWCAAQPTPPDSGGRVGAPMLLRRCLVPVERRRQTLEVMLDRTSK